MYSEKAGTQQFKKSVPLGIQKFASNDRRVFLEVQLIMHGRTTASCLHGDSYIAKPHVLGKLLSMVAAV